MSGKDVEERLRALPPERRKELAAEVEERLARFAVLFEEIGNGELSRSEEALLRTYLMAEVTGLLPSGHPSP